MTDTHPIVMKAGLHRMVVCVPDRWDDHQVCAFAARENPISGYWSVSTPEAYDTDRVPCAEREGYVHMMLDA